MNPDHAAPVLQMRNIHVRYGDHKALNGVDFDLYAGEIHGLVGEHRAGKSTLVKLLSGAVPKQQGQIMFKGQEIPYFTPKSAMKHRIGMIYQDQCHIIPTMNAVENIFVGRDLTRWWIGLNDRYMVAKTQAIFTRIGVKVQLDRPLKALSEADRYMVELAKILSIEPEILIFDEISSKLTPDEMETIYKLLFTFKQQGQSVIYISHNMDEIFQFADRVTILKNGYRLGTEEVKDLDKIKLLKLTYSFVLSREELESDNRELYLLKKYNEHIIKNLPEGVIILDPNQRVYLINYAAINILELNETEILSQGVAAIFNADTIDHPADLLDKIHAKAAASWDELEYGNEKVLKVHIFPFKDDDYKFLGTIIIIEDISKERSFNEYLLRTQKIASVAELAAGVAHEINNPLGIIQNYVTLLKRKPIDADGVAKLNKVEGELQRIGGIVESLLSFSKLKTLPLKRINLAAVIDETLLLLNHKLKEKHLTLLWENPTPEVPLIGDENKLKQVFLNLIVNSIEAVMYAGTIEIKVAAHPEQRYVEVSVIDDGCGIPEEIRQKIFDPFFTTKVGKKNTGLGLSICQHIIESHQGVITCASGEKTTFQIRLPMLES